VIAMTAHALTGDREKALEDGFNDYVSKPVDVLQLASILMRWLVHHAGPRPSFTVEVPRPVLPSAELDTARALERLGGNQYLYRRLLMLFQADHAQDAELLRVALSNADDELAHRLAHMLKGMAVTIGATHLNEAYRQMEFAIRNHEVAQYETYLDQMQYRLSATLQAIEGLAG